jgi:Yip1 domain
VVIFSIASFAVIANFIGMENVARKQIESNSRAAGMSADQKEAAIRQAGTPARLVISYCVVAIVSVLTLLIIAGISLGGLSAAGGKVKFGQVLGATSYATVPFALLNLVMTTAVILASTDRDSLDISNLIATNIGAFLDKETTNKALFSIAGSLDLISFAHIGFLGYGLSKVSRVSFSTCVMIVVGLWVVYVLGKAGFASLF